MPSCSNAFSFVLYWVPLCFLMAFEWALLLFPLGYQYVFYGVPLFSNGFPSLFCWVLLCFLLGPLSFLMAPTSLLHWVRLCFLLGSPLFSYGSHLPFYCVPLCFLLGPSCFLIGSLCFLIDPLVLLLGSPLFGGLWPPGSSPSWWPDRPSVHTVAPSFV